MNLFVSQITLGQLLDISPKVRNELSKLLKLNKTNIISALSNLEPSITLINNIDHNYISTSKNVDEDVLAMVLATVGNSRERLLLDTCSNLNVVTEEFLSSLENYKIIGTGSGKIRQAAKDCPDSSSNIVQFSFTIRNYPLMLNFRVLDNPDPFHDILIGLKAQADHKLVVFPHENNLSHMKDDGLYEVLAYLNQDLDDEKLVCFIKKIDSDISNSNLSPKSEGTMCLIKNESNINRIQFKEHQQESSETLTPLIYIHNDSFLNTITERYRPRVVKILEDYISIIATSSDNLSPFKLTPHEIHLIPGTQPIKQRSYRISKFKADILKKELIKLINKKLIVPSHSAWSSPVVIVPKSNGKWRICIDYRKVNDVTIKDAYSLTFIDEIFDGLNGA